MLTSPVEFPVYGKIKKLQMSKEDLLQFWKKVHKESGLSLQTREKVETIRRDDDGVFTVVTPRGQYRARTVVLALGRRGTPRKLDVPGEDLPKVMYSLIDAEAYTGSKILVVGGGDSAVETAMGLAHQRGNTVTLSYRKDSFSRIKERNTQRLKDYLKKGNLKVVFNSQPVEIPEDDRRARRRRPEAGDSQRLRVGAGGEPAPQRVPAAGGRSAGITRSHSGSPSRGQTTRLSRVTAAERWAGTLG